MVVLTAVLATGAACDGGGGGDNGGGNGGGTDADAAPTDGTSDVGDVADATDPADGTTADGETTDGEGGRSVYRGFGVVEVGGSSRYYAAEYTEGTTLSSFVLGENPFGSGNIGLAASQQRVFVLDQACADTPSNCDGPQRGSVEQVQVAESEGFNQLNTFVLPRGTYDPRDVAYVDANQRFYVTSSQSAKIYAYESGNKKNVKTFDTAPFDEDTAANGDDDPDPGQMVVDGKRLLVTLRMFAQVKNDEGDFVPAAESNAKLAVLDTESGEFMDFDSGASGEQALGLQIGNAIGIERAADGVWAVGLRGRDRSDDGAIVRLERTDEDSYQVGETLVGEGRLGGRLESFAMTGEFTGVAVVSPLVGEGTPPSLVRFDASGEGDVQTQKLDQMTWPGTGVCATPDNAQVWANDVRATPRNGMRIFDTETWELVNDQPWGPRAKTPECVIPFLEHATGGADASG
ncbi:MAG: hypothetical protein ABEL76_01995 [Bradymonadaceae bacterium]